MDNKSKVNASSPVKPTRNLVGAMTPEELAGYWEDDCQSVPGSLGHGKDVFRRDIGKYLLVAGRNNDAGA